MGDNKNKEINPLVGCKVTFMFGCFFLLALFCFGTYMIISNTGNFLNSAITFLNDDLEISKPELTGDSESIKANIDSQVKSVGENKVEISEADLTILARDRFDDLKNLTVDIKDGYMIFYWEIFRRDEKLYAIAEIKNEDKDNLYIDRLGTKRFFFPKRLNRIVAGFSFNGVDFFKDEESKLIYEILDSDQVYTIEDIKFENDKLILTINVDIKLFDND